jgi:hypothetical protein
MGGYDQKKMLATRAELIDVKPKVLAARVKRRIRTIRSQIEGIGAAFEDIDQTVVFEGEELLRAFNDYERTVNESVEWLNSSPEYG